MKVKEIFYTKGKAILILVDQNNKEIGVMIVTDYQLSRSLQARKKEKMSVEFKYPNE